MIKTQRLLLREYTMEDFPALYEILSDPETMAHYPAPYDQEKTRHWIAWNLENYRFHGFGLWAVVRRDTGEFIGDCGLSMQCIGNRLSHPQNVLAAGLRQRGRPGSAGLGLPEYPIQYSVLLLQVHQPGLPADGSGKWDAQGQGISRSQKHDFLRLCHHPAGMGGFTNAV